MTDYYLRKHNCAVCNGPVILKKPENTITCQCGVVNIPQWVLVDAYSRSKYMRHFESIKAEKAVYWLKLMEDLEIEFSKNPESLL